METNKMIKHLKDELIELLLKISETNLNQSDLFTEEKPSLFLPEGRTIFLKTVITILLVSNVGK